MNLLTSCQGLLGLRWARRHGSRVLTIITVVLCHLLMLGCAYLFYIVTLPRCTVHSLFIRLLISTYLHIQFVTSYYLVLLTNPGIPPINMLKEEEKLPTCEKCGRVRPERTHHCSICQHCVLKYDHHCFWTNGCIGLMNHGYFLKFLLFGFLSASFILIQFIPVLLYGSWLSSYPFHLKMIIIFLSLWILIGSSGACLMMFLLQVKIITHNETSIEFERDAFKKRDLRLKGLKYTYPYSTTLIEHIQELFGPHWLKSILLPFKFTPSHILDMIT